MPDAFQDQWYGSTIPPEPPTFQRPVVPHAAPSALPGKPRSHAKRSDTATIVLALLAALGLIAAGTSLWIAVIVRNSANTKIGQLQAQISTQAAALRNASANGSANYGSLSSRVNVMNGKLNTLAPYSSICSVLSTGPQGDQDYFIPCSEQRPSS
jgi:hypothetical protein